jgi:hypothetical protein
MKRINYGMLLPALFFLWPVLSWAQVGEDYNIEIEGRYWMPKLDATVKVVESNLGSDINLVNDLGFDDRKNFGEGHLQVKFARKHKFNFSFIQLKWEGDKNITRPIEFGGQIFTVDTNVQSKANLDLYKAGYEYDFLLGKTGFLGGTIDVLVAKVDVELKAPALAINEKEDKTVPIPMIGLIGRIYPIKWVNLTGKVSGIPLGSYGYVIDAEASLNINPVKYVGISGGYRYLQTNLKYDNNFLDFKLNGPFVALDIRF